MVRKKIYKYINDWKKCDYENDIPDKVPDEIMNLRLAPSYKAIALAILSNDVSLSSLGFTPKHSKWYDKLKKIEIEKRLTNNVKCATISTKKGDAHDD